MARTWIAVRVELLGGRGEELWPPPGRVLVVGPKHTFADLAEAVDVAFARWDRNHLCEFRLVDGRTVTDEGSAEESATSHVGPLGGRPLLLDRTKVHGTVGPGDEFSYVFDFGDGWTHRCTVEEEKVDPREQLGVVPAPPTAVWGWGMLPDQYGRRWADDPGEGPLPRRPQGTDPMLTGAWPEPVAPPVDLSELRGATYRRDLAAIREALEGKDVDGCLQHVGAAVLLLLVADRDATENLAASVVNRLTWRDGPGDAELAEDLLAELRRTPLAARTVPVDLAEVSNLLEGDPVLTGEGGYLDLHTGEVLPAVLTDEAYVGEDAVVDVEDDPDRWLRLDHVDGGARWQDMADFASTLPEPTRQTLLTAIEGRGAFGRFRHAVGQSGLVDRWRTFSDDRAMGRARASLAELGVRARPPAGL